MTARVLLDGAGIDRHEAERLLMSVTGLDRAGILALDELSDGQRARFELLVARRRSGEPLQYIEAVVPFGAIELAVDGRVLIPRPETEYLWELASARPSPSIVVDIGTGSGALALSAKHRWPEADVYGTDVSSDALDVARSNGARLGLEVDWRQGDLFAALDPAVRGRVDLVMSNPPYVAEHEFDSLPAVVRLYEPRSALVAGRDGLAVIRRLGAEVGAWLAPGGEVWCEIGETQGERASELVAGLQVEVRRDLAGRHRYVRGVAR